MSVVSLRCAPTRYSNRKRHYNGAEHGREHVVLRIPFVALTTEPVHPLAGRDRFGYHRFENFKKAADGKNYGDRNPKTPGSLDSAESDQQFANGIGKEKSEPEMRNAIKVVTRKAKKSFAQSPSGIFA
jgi:hypothetical protein